MASVTKTATIPAPRADVWAVLADYGAISAWAPNVDHSCLMSDQIEGVGMARRNQIGRNTVVETVLVFEPGDTLSYSISGLPPVIKSVSNAWHLESAGEHTTATLITEIDTGSRSPQKAIAKAVGRTMGAASDQMLGGLAAHFAGKAHA